MLETKKINEIKKIMRQQGFTQKGLANYCGYSLSMVNQALNRRAYSFNLELKLDDFISHWEDKPNLTMIQDIKNKFEELKDTFDKLVKIYEHDWQLLFTDEDGYYEDVYNLNFENFLYLMGQTDCKFIYLVSKNINVLGADFNESSWKKEYEKNNIIDLLQLF